MTRQEEAWKGKLGGNYTNRNLRTVKELNKLYLDKHGISRTRLNTEFLKPIHINSKILEVGCNIATQLQLLQKMKYKNLWGIELQSDAVERAKKRTSNINIIKASAFDIPFKDNYFDLVFTSGVLLHISPDDIAKALDEIYRCTRSYIWGYEYYIPTGYKMVKWRDEDNLLWKTDFAKLFLDRFPSLKLVNKKILDYKEDENQSTMYLLKK